MKILSLPAIFQSKCFYSFRQIQLMFFKYFNQNVGGTPVHCWDTFETAKLKDDIMRIS